MLRKINHIIGFSLNGFQGLHYDGLADKLLCVVLECYFNTIFQTNGNRGGGGSRCPLFSILVSKRKSKK